MKCLFDKFDILDCKYNKEREKSKYSFQKKVCLYCSFNIKEKRMGSYFCKVELIKHFILRH